MKLVVQQWVILGKKHKEFLGATDEQMSQLDSILRDIVGPDYVADVQAYVPKERPLGARDPRSPEEKARK